MMKELTVRTGVMDDYGAVCDLLKLADDHHVSLLPGYFQIGGRET